MSFSLRMARPDDIEALERLIPASARALQAQHYSQDLIEAALGPIFAVDPILIEDGTYFVAESEGEIVACGGWSKRNRPYGSSTESAELLDPNRDPAHIRAFFVHPDFARRGIGSAIMGASEQAASQAGFTQLELVATLTGEPLYARFGFSVQSRYDIPTATNERMPVVKMAKVLS